MFIRFRARSRGVVESIEPILTFSVGVSHRFRPAEWALAILKSFLGRSLLSAVWQVAEKVAADGTTAAAVEGTQCGESGSAASADGG